MQHLPVDSTHLQASFYVPRIGGLPCHHTEQDVNVTLLLQRPQKSTVEVFDMCIWPGTRRWMEEQLGERQPRHAERKKTMIITTWKSKAADMEWMWKYETVVRTFVKMFIRFCESLLYEICHRSLVFSYFHASCIFLLLPLFWSCSFTDGFVCTVVEFHMFESWLRTICVVRNVVQDQSTGRHRAAGRWLLEYWTS